MKTEIFPGTPKKMIVNTVDPWELALDDGKKRIESLWRDALAGHMSVADYKATLERERDYTTMPKLKKYIERFLALENGYCVYPKSEW